MPASQVDDQILIQQSPWESNFTIAAKSYHPKGPFIAEIVGFDPEHDFKRLWLGSRMTTANHGKLVQNTCIATFGYVELINRPRLLHIRGAASNCYLLYVDLHSQPVLYPIFSKIEVGQWLMAKQQWLSNPAEVLPPGTMVTASATSLHPIMFMPIAAIEAPFGGKVPKKPKKPEILPPAVLHVEPPAGKRRIKLG